MRKDDPGDPAPGSDPLPAYIERLASVFSDSGIPRMPARVFAALLTRDDGRLTSQQLSELLDISPAAVSGAVRYLAQLNLVTREREPGTRRDRYRVMDEIFQRALFERDRIMARWETSLAEGVTLLGPGSAAGRRLAESVAMFQFMRGEVAGMLTRWEAHRAMLRAQAGTDADSAPEADSEAGAESDAEADSGTEGESEHGDTGRAGSASQP